MGKTLLLVSDHPEDRQFAEQAALVNSLDLVVAETAPEGVALLQKHSPITLLVDASTAHRYQAFESAVRETLGLFTDQTNASAMHFIGTDFRENASYLIPSPLFGHFVTRSQNDSANDGAYYGRIIQHGVQKQAFGIAGLLAPETAIQTERLISTEQKPDALDAVYTFARAAHFTSRMAALITNSVDELLCTAIWDSPIDDYGKPLFKANARGAQVKLEGKHAIELQIGFDGTHLAATVTDRFGSLEKSTILGQLAPGAAPQEGTRTRMPTAPLGFNLAEIQPSGGSLFFASESRVKTEATVVFKLAPDQREFSRQFRFLSTHFYF